MTALDERLPIASVEQPDSTEAVADLIRDCRERGEPLYPVGGATSLDFGMPAVDQGVAVRLASLNSVVDYPARDLTVTVEAGVTLDALRDVLSDEGQQLPLDAAQSDEATIGGVIASNWNGPRRYGMGTVRDHVIGITAVDGRGVAFQGGGRVVKNVAGYDFCKLLTGSLGTLAVITQVTLKLRPLAEVRHLVVAECDSLDVAERLLAAQAETQVPLAALEILAGPAWRDGRLGGLSIARDESLLVIGWLEGDAVEVSWMRDRLLEEWRAFNVTVSSLGDLDAIAVMSALTNFPSSESSALTLKVNTRPSGVCRVIAAVREAEPQAAIASHAGNGVVHIAYPEFPQAGLAHTILSQLQPIAGTFDGSVVVLSNPSGLEMTRNLVWGSPRGIRLMEAVKTQFDPDGILNPQRFVYTNS